MQPSVEKFAVGKLQNVQRGASRNSRRSRFLVLLEKKVVRNEIKD